MNGLKIVQNELVATLLEEMREALSAIEQGEYDSALEILQERCRPINPLAEFTCSYSLEVTRIGRDIIRALLTTTDIYCIEILANSISRLNADEEADKGKALSVAELISECGIVLR
jgi:hypothetical protein